MITAEISTEWMSCTRIQSTQSNLRGNSRRAWAVCTGNEVAPANNFRNSGFATPAPCVLRQRCYVGPMDTVLRYRGREIRPGEVAFIQQTIADNPGASRRELSQKVCTAWGWMQPNGQLREAVCRGLLLELHRAGPIVLPAA
jgi:hypothetical protein